MQEGAGVRQLIEDELRRAGTRLRDLGVRIELGLQESVTSAVRGGYGVTFISRAVGRGRPRRGDARRGARRRARARSARSSSCGRAAGRRRAPPGRSSSSRASALRVIVRWSLAELPDVLGELGIGGRCSSRARAGTRRSTFRSPAAGRRSRPTGSRCRPPRTRVLALGGGSAIDTAKAASAATGLPLVSVPTTYSGAEWTRLYGVRDAGPAHASAAAPARTAAGSSTTSSLTLDLPRAETVGTALNALAHCAEALYVATQRRRGDELRARGRDADRASGCRGWSTSRATVEAREGAPARRGGRRARRSALAGLALAHAIAQALGGRYGLPHGAMNALCLPPALRFNAEVRAGGGRPLRRAIGAATSRPRRSRSSRASAGSTGCARSGSRPTTCPSSPRIAAGRPGEPANPTPATADEIEAMLRSIF